MPAVPPQTVLEAFGVSETPQLLAGGQGTTYQAGNIILKPIADATEANWLAELFSSIQEIGFRVARPILSAHGGWFVDNWSASRFVEGVEIQRRPNEKIVVSRSFHRALLGYTKPQHIAIAQHPWAIADRFAWGEEAVRYHQRLAPSLNVLVSLVQPVQLSSQLIHGDMTGNILFHELLAPAVIDMAPYWRPAEFATAIIVVDSLVWEGSEDAIIHEFTNTNQSYQLLVRASIRRIMELDGIYKQYGTDCLAQVDAYEHLIDLLCTQSTRK